jgi:magnesium chelatase family protein
MQNQKIVVSLSPADLKKEGPSFDLPIALAYMLSAGDVKFDSKNKVFFGELGLDGILRPIKGTLPLVQEAKDKGFEEVYLPIENAVEAALIDGIKVFPAKNLKEVIEHIDETKVNSSEISKNQKRKISPQPKTEIIYEKVIRGADFSDIRGQEGAKRGLEIAAAGGHNIAMYGPPGTGKTMLARAFSAILPELSTDEVLEITGIHSVVGTNRGELVVQPPFRSQHHTAS